MTNILISFVDLFVVDKESYAQWDQEHGIPPIFTDSTHRQEEVHYPKPGVEVTLSCSALGQPMPKIIWFKDMMEIDRKKDPLLLLGHDEDSLKLRNVKQKDSGHYTCLARNKHGYVSKNFTVQVNEPILHVTEYETNNVQNSPQFSQSDSAVPDVPENTTVEVEGKATLECKTQVIIVLRSFDF